MINNRPTLTVKMSTGPKPAGNARRARLRFGLSDDAARGEAAPQGHRSGLPSRDPRGRGFGHRGMCCVVDDVEPKTDLSALHDALDSAAQAALAAEGGDRERASMTLLAASVAGAAAFVRGSGEAEALDVIFNMIGLLITGNRPDGLISPPYGPRIMCRRDYGPRRTGRPQPGGHNA
jgi:hypothetical protein